MKCNLSYILFSLKQTNTADQIIQVKGQLGELKDIAHDNIKKMEEREENLEELEDRADVLAQAVRREKERERERERERVFRTLCPFSPHTL